MDDEGSKFNPKSYDDQSVNNRFQSNERISNRPISEFAKEAVNSVKSSNLLASDFSDNETNSMRIILPVFIENEQKYAQHDRKRKIQSSPVKRSSQDSSSLEHQLHVS